MENNKLVWKMKDGREVPLNEIPFDEINSYRKSAKEFADRYGNLARMFEQILETLDKRINDEFESLEEQLLKIKKIKDEV